MGCGASSPEYVVGREAAGERMGPLSPGRHAVTVPGQHAVAVLGGRTETGLGRRALTLSGSPGQIGEPQEIQATLAHHNKLLLELAAAQEKLEKQVQDAQLLLGAMQNVSGHQFEQARSSAVAPHEKVAAPGAATVVHAVAHSVATDVAQSTIDQAERMVQEVAAAPPGTYESVEDVGKEFVERGKDILEQGIQKAEELQESVLRLGDPGASAADVGQDAVDLLDVIDGVVSFVRGLFGVAKRQSVPTNVQDLQLSQRTQAERALAKYSALGQVLVNVASHAMAAMPFGGPAAAILGAVYVRGAQAAKNSVNCARLLELMQRCDKQMARVACRKKTPPVEVLERLQELADIIASGAELMHNYAGSGFIVRLITSKSDEGRFRSIHCRMQEAMQGASFAMSIEILSSEPDYKDESACLRSAVCQAAGLPEADADKALAKLNHNNPGQLKQLLQAHGSFGDKVIQAELESLSKRVDLLEQAVVQVKKEVQECESRLTILERQMEEISNADPAGLAPWMGAWWRQAAHRLAKTIPAPTFLSKLVDFFKQKGLVDQLIEYEEALGKEGFSAAMSASSKIVARLDDGRPLHFFHNVLLPSTDPDGNGVITRSELRQLHLLGIEFARKEDLDFLPNSWEQLLEALFIGFDRALLITDGQHGQGKHAGVHAVTEKLQVQAVIDSYNTAALLDDYVEGTRLWMFDKVRAWLSAALAAPKSKSSEPRSRAFLLLADPGMGKSVFSAVMQNKLVVQKHKNNKLVQVRHFFKVGQARAQGKVMLLCLAHQLCKQLPGMVDQLLPVVEEHGAAAHLSMDEVFEIYLLNPLQALDTPEMQQRVVILLDALDEAMDGNAGWEPVAKLVATEFVKLPAWVKMILTGRPHTQAQFAHWEPTWIQPDEDKNKEDLRVLLATRLQQAGLVAEELQPEAVKLLVEKSEGQFIYTKYAMEIFRQRSNWSLDDIRAELPSGLGGIFQHIMDTLQGALAEERPDLLVLLRQKLLPILVASKEPLSTVQISIIADEELGQVEYLLSLMVNIFPTRPGSHGAPCVFPYHKTVVDFLCTSEPAYRVDVRLGHEHIGSACHATLAPLHARDIAEAEGPLQTSHGETSQCGDSMRAYALRYALGHLLVAGSACVQQLEDLLLDVVGFWPSAYLTGFGPEVAKDLVCLEQHCPSAVTKDLVRWLQLVGNYLARHPKAALQLACDAPHSSILAQHANQLPQKPQALLLTKEDTWPALVSTLKAHKRSVTSVALLQGLIVSGSDDGTVRVWDLATGNHRATMEGHTDEVKAVAITPDGTLCASSGVDKSVRIWDLQDFTCKAALKGHADCVSSLALSGSICVSGSRDATIRVWDLQQLGSCTVLDNKSSVNGVALSKDGLTCVTAARDGHVRVWNLKDGTWTPGATLKGHKGEVYGVALAQNPKDGICVSCSEDKTLRVWRLCDGSCTVRKGHTKDVLDVALSSDGQTCASVSEDKTARIWDLSASGCKATLKGHSDDVLSVALSEDGLTCVTSSWDASIRVWSISPKKRKANVSGGGSHISSILCVARSADGLRCASGSEDRTIRVYDLCSGDLLATLVGHAAGVSAVSLCPEGRTCISQSDDGTVRVWNVGSATQTAAYEDEEADKHWATAERWRRRATAGAMQHSEQQWVAWEEDEGEVIHLGPACARDAQSDAGSSEDGSSGTSSEEEEDGQVVVYLMPPATVAEGPFYSPQAQTVSFYTEEYVFMCYQLTQPNSSLAWRTQE
ncbi:hypothetical protein DUNSADRAFT_17630 [Dunaliella salina]|uniref:Nephrocystin 3-like N-terminal domain-containing protein n=1 Tax=Dunaliella salina TaxID=3046 RepID=A0ABQ7GZW5_DUNSA|nr:hypothetical protein DUNSADRAFT_17630 [Dunaliella salina]|eukprot:KAF5840146.1 hypothetical protein DUNSADRAFT_17630 [Dunaliella salina]